MVEILGLRETSSLTLRRSFFHAFMLIRFYALDITTIVLLVKSRVKLIADFSFNPATYCAANDLISIAILETKFEGCIALSSPATTPNSSGKPASAPVLVTLRSGFCA